MATEKCRAVVVRMVRWRYGIGDFVQAIQIVGHTTGEQPDHLLIAPEILGNRRIGDACGFEDCS